MIEPIPPVACTRTPTSTGNRMMACPTPPRISAVSPIAGEIRRHLTCTHMDFEFGERELANLKLTLTGAHFNLELHRNVIR